MDHKNENYNMFDLIAYRIKFMEHPISKARWCIYPSYDYTHCLVDALENITHSLCTLEFESRRASYYWLLHVRHLHCPAFILNVTQLFEMELIRSVGDLMSRTAALEIILGLFRSIMGSDALDTVSLNSQAMSLQGHAELSSTQPCRSRI